MQKIYYFCTKLITLRKNELFGRSIEISQQGSSTRAKCSINFQVKKTHR